MSVIIASGEQISKSPINKSLSKQMYSFPREERFGKFHKKALSTADNFYNLPSVLSKRSTSFGFGTKSDFTKHHKYNDSESRYKPTDFNDKNPKSPAFTFGISRHYFEKVYNESDKHRDKNIPGPGSYRYIKSIGDDARKISFGLKLEEKSLGVKSKVPGPGQYPIISFNPEGKYQFSKYRNATSICFGNSKGIRFNYKDKDKLPGPGQYKENGFFNNTGFIFNSKFRSNVGKTIGGKIGESKFQNKSNIFVKAAPGPGEYRVFSEFGIYESKNAKTEENRQTNFSSYKNTAVKTTTNF